MGRYWPKTDDFKVKRRKLSHIGHSQYNLDRKYKLKPRLPGNLKTKIFPFVWYLKQDEFPNFRVCTYIYTHRWDTICSWQKRRNARVCFAAGKTNIEHENHPNMKRNIHLPSLHFWVPPVSFLGVLTAKSGCWKTSHHCSLSGMEGWHLFRDDMDVSSLWFDSSG